MSVSITVVGAQAAQDTAQGQFVQYNIQTDQNGEKVSFVGRSFRDFQNFDRSWRKLYNLNIKLPKTVIFGQNNPDVVARRIVGLTEYLRSCAEIRSIRPNVAAFLIVKRPLLDDVKPKFQQPAPSPQGPSAPRPKGDFTTSISDAKPAPKMDKPAQSENQQQNGQNQQPTAQTPPQQNRNGPPSPQQNNLGGGQSADCHNCGVPNAGAPFCSNCGEKQRNNAPPTGPPAGRPVAQSFSAGFGAGPSGPRPGGAPPPLSGQNSFSNSSSVSRSSASSFSDSRSSQSSGGGYSPPRGGFGGVSPAGPPAGFGGVSGGGPQAGFGNVFAQGGGAPRAFGGRPGASGPPGGPPLPSRKPTIISLGQRPPSSVGGFSGAQRGPPPNAETPPPRDFAGDLYEGNKRRRRKSFMRTYTKDHWSVADTSNIQRLFRANGDNYCIFSDTALMYDPRFKSSKRVLMLTDNAVYLLSPGTLSSKWRMPVQDIQSVSLSTCGDHFVAIHPRDQSQPDQLILCPRKTEFLIALRFLMERTANLSLDMSFADDLAVYLQPDRESWVTFRERDSRGENINLQVLDQGAGAAITVSVPQTLLADPQRDYDEQMRLIEDAEGRLYN